MEPKSVPGCGLIAVATQDFPCGTLVHASKAFVNVPSAAVIKNRSVCIGCYAPTTIKKLAVCSSCKAPYCSAACRDESGASHIASGECRVINKVVTAGDHNKQQASADLDILLISAAVLARAEREGHLLPVSQHPFPPCAPNLVQQQMAKAVAEVEERKKKQQVEEMTTEVMKQDDDNDEDEEEEGMFGFFEDESKQKEVDAQLKKKEQERLTADVELVRSAPRECIAGLFPGVAAAASQPAAAPLLASLCAPLFPSRPASILPKNNDDDQQLKSVILQDEQHRYAAMQQAPEPSFVEFCTLVSNICLASAAELDRYDRIRGKYEELFLKNNQSDGDEEQQQQQQHRRLDPNFYRHVCSQIHCNCFGFFSASGDDIVKGAGVFNTSSLFNHSCVPNLLRRVACGKHQCFYAQRDIKKGDELTISYAARFEPGFREHMLAQYRFFCRCDVCTASASAPPPLRCASCFAKGDLRPLLPTASKLYECDTCLLVCSRE